MNLPSKVKPNKGRRTVVFFKVETQFAREGGWAP